MNRVCISLLTDFGLQDSYVGQMKGVIAGINPQATIIDLTHQIPPQQIMQAGIALADSVDAFPDGTIHLCVVDPGVGTSRRAVAAEIGNYRFVCPDNGLLTGILRREPLRRVVELDEPQWWRGGVSTTFHGRDLFAPVAAHWSLGHDLVELGSPLTSPLIELPWPEMQLEGNGRAGLVRGEVMSIDHFGNLITNIALAALATASRDVVVDFAGRRLAGIQRCYGDCADGDCIALVGSSGRLEIAVVNGNAATVFNAPVGEPVSIRWTS